MLKNLEQPRRRGFDGGGLIAQHLVNPLLRKDALKDFLALEAVGALAGGFDAARNHHPCVERLFNFSNRVTGIFEEALFLACEVATLGLIVIGLGRWGVFFVFTLFLLLEGILALVGCLVNC